MINVKKTDISGTLAQVQAFNERGTQIVLQNMAAQHSLNEVLLYCIKFSN